jgi:hypothetical protein
MTNVDDNDNDNGNGNGKTIPITWQPYSKQEPQIKTTVSKERKTRETQSSG